jgi:hypothetical protein
MTATYSVDICSFSLVSTIPWTFGLRWDCNGHLSVYDSDNQQTSIYLTNHQVFEAERNEFLAREGNSYLTPEGKRVSNFPFGDGIQFDAHISDGYIFRSCTYIPGTIRGEELS